MPHGYQSLEHTLTRFHYSNGILFKIVAFIFVGTFFLGTPQSSWAEDYKQIPGAIQVHTTFDGSGEHSLEEIVQFAKEKDVEFLIPTDHDLQVMEYGVFPLQSIIKRREERDSVIKIGPDRYLNQIKLINNKQKDVLVIPGVQSSPFYYWTGTPFGVGLTAHQYRKEMLLIGMKDPEDYRDLPLLHRGFSMQYVRQLLPRSLVFLVAFLLSGYLVSQKRMIRKLGFVLAIFSLLLMINYHPFKSSLFDPYSGDQGVKPFQELIDYVADRNGLTFWAHPESNYAVVGVQLGPVTLKTGHYIEDLFHASGYTGFEAIYGDTITATKPGKHWDRLLLDYCTGKREKPVFGIAGADYHGGNSSQLIDEFQTVVFVQQKSSTEILKALAAGRCYMFRKLRDPAMNLKNYEVRDESGGSRAISGEEIILSGKPVVNASISTVDGSPQEVIISIVRGGEKIEEFNGKTPIEIQYIDHTKWEGKQFYRIDVRKKKGGYLLSNPIFVTRK